MNPIEFPMLGAPRTVHITNRDNSQSTPVVIEQSKTSSSYASLVNPKEGLSLKFIEALIINGTNCAKIEQQDVASEIDY